MRLSHGPCAVYNGFKYLVYLQHRGPPVTSQPTPAMVPLPTVPFSASSQRVGWLNLDHLAQSPQTDLPCRESKPFDRPLLSTSLVINRPRPSSCHREALVLHYLPYISDTPRSRKADSSCFFNYFLTCLPPSLNHNTSHTQQRTCAFEEWTDITPALETSLNNTLNISNHHLPLLWQLLSRYSPRHVRPTLH